MGVKVNWKGLDKFLKKLQSRQHKAPQAVARAIYEEAVETISDAKTLTPVDEGVLRASGHVQLPVTEGSKTFVVMGFGGPAGSGNQGLKNSKDVGYAVYVHEDLTAHHNVGQAKFLETPLNNRKPTMSKRLAERVDKEFKKG